jgi:hypothetical protein
MKTTDNEESVAQIGTSSQAGCSSNSMPTAFKTPGSASKLDVVEH